jgi:uncharacterized protein (DUF1501 family)
MATNPLLPVSRRALLAGTAGAGLIGLRARGAAPGTRLVVVLAHGGWDPSLTVDPKPGSPFVDGALPDLNPDDPLDIETVARFGSIDVTLNERRRPGVSRFFEAWWDHTAVLNGLWVGSLSHWQATIRVLTGTTRPDTPDLAVVAGVTAGEGLPLAAMDLSGLSRFGPPAPLCARSGIRGQLKGLLDPSTRYPTDVAGFERGAWAPSADDRDAIARWRTERLARLLEDGAPEAGRLEAAGERAAAAATAKALEEQAAGLVDTIPLGSRTLFREQVPFAVDLLAADVCQSVVLSTGQPWDTHADHGRQHDCWNATFLGLDELASGLSAAGLLERTVVFVVSELGRTPLRNPQGGTDHFPYTSALVLGAGVVGGRKVGGTDDALVGLPLDPATGTVDDRGDLMRYDGVAAGILAAAGVDPADVLPGVEPVTAFLA